MNLKPLGVVREIVESAGMWISYACEDLVFLEHNAFLLQFTANDREILVHTNMEAEPSGIRDDIARLQKIAASHGLTFTIGSWYTLTQAEGENIRIEFLQPCQPVV